MIKKIIEFFYPNTNNPEDFILKNVPSGFSPKHRYIVYSANKGKTFNHIFEANEPMFSFGDAILRYNWTYDRLSFNAENTPFSTYKSKFKSLKDVQDYHNLQYQLYINGLKDVEEQRLKYMEDLNENIK